jgi:hypothetical protein
MCFYPQLKILSVANIVESPSRKPGTRLFCRLSEMTHLRTNDRDIAGKNLVSLSLLLKWSVYQHLGYKHYQ